MEEKKEYTEQVLSSAPMAINTGFYRDNFSRMIIFSTLLLTVCIASILLNIVQFIYKPSPRYFAAYMSEQNTLDITPAVPLSEPNLTTEALLQWATQAATACYTFDFNRGEEKIRALRSYFTAQGYQHFLEALKLSKTYETVKQKQLVAAAVPTGAPVILREDIESATSRRAWQVQLPMLVSYQSASEVIKQNIIVTMLIVRVDTLESPKGIAIAQFLMQEGK